MRERACSFAVCVCNAEFCSCSVVVCRCSAAIWLLREVFWFSSCFSCSFSRLLSVCREAFWTKQTQFHSSHTNSSIKLAQSIFHV